MFSLRSIRDRVSWFSQVGYVTVNLFLKTEMQNHAAAVAFYFLLSIIPLILLIIFTFGFYFPDYPELLQKFLAFLSTLNSKLNIDLMQNVKMEGKTVHLTGGVSILILLWSSRGLLKSVQSSFRVIFADFKKRNFVAVAVISFLIIPFSFLIVILSMLGLYVVNHFNEYLTALPVIGELLRSLFIFAGAVIPYALTWLIIFFFYYQLPSTKPPVVSALICSALCTFSILLLKLVFGHFLRIDQYNLLYGSVGAIIFVLIWVYFVCIQFFLWAQFLYVAGKIDVIALEKVFLDSAERGKMAMKVENFLFKHSSRIFQKYGKQYAHGDVIIMQNDDSASIYYLYSGQVGLYREIQGRMVRIGGLKKGEIFGEMAYLLGERRTATVVAEADCFLFTLSPETLEALMSYSASLSRRIIESLCQRISKMNRGLVTSGFGAVTHKHPVYKPQSGEV